MRTVLLAALGLALSTTALAAPDSLHHQGRLFDALGAPMTGDHQLDVKLFDDETAGTELWADSLATVTFSNGYYTVQLDGVDADTLGGDDVWFEIAVDSGTALPRMKLSSVPYALRAGWAANADGLTAGADIDANSVSINGTTIIDSSGSIPATSISGLSNGLDDLGCTTDRDIAVYSGGSWSCVNESALSIDAGTQLTGTVAIGNLPVGNTSSHVSAGDHGHDINSLTGNLQFGSVTTCDSSAAGAVRYQGGTFEGCDGNSWQALTEPPLGSDWSNPAPNCRELLAARPGLSDGIYWLDGDGGIGTNVIQAYCDMTTDGGGWTLAYKISDGVGGGDRNTLWTGGNTNTTDTALMDRDQETAQYANAFAGAWWGDSLWTEARLELLVGGSADAEIVFGFASGATNSDWYRIPNITSSSWDDLDAAAVHNVDAIDGGNTRFWYLSAQHAGCALDEGWLVAPLAGPCTWDTTYNNRIAYSGANVHQNWTTGTISTAEAMAVWLR